MSTFDDLDQALGIDMSDPDQALARDLVEADDDMLEELVRIRKSLAKMSGTAVADRMGRNRSVVTNFEKLTADPHLSTIRRYAHAIGARITHIVEWVDPKGTGSPSETEATRPDRRLFGVPIPNRRLTDLERKLIRVLEERQAVEDAGQTVVNWGPLTVYNARGPFTLYNGRIPFAGRTARVQIGRRSGTAAAGPGHAGHQEVEVRGSSNLISSAVGAGL